MELIEKSQSLFSFERAVLGCILINPDFSLPIVRAGLKDDPEHFADRRHQIIFDAILKLEVVDVALLYEKVGGQNGIDGIFIESLLGAVPISSNAEYYTKGLLRESLSRFRESVSLKLKQGEITTREAKEAESHYTWEPNKTIVCGEAIAEATDAHLKAIIAMDGKPQGIPTGMPIFDSYVPGWREGEYHIIGARTSVGKTALAINCAIAAAEGGYPCLMFSCEMELTTIGERIYQIIGGINMNNVRRGFLTPNEKAKIDITTDRVRRMKKIHIDTDQRLTIGKISERVRDFVSLHGTSLIVVDYLQRVRPNKRARDIRQDIAEISQELQTLAKETGCPFLVLAQVNRSGIGKTDMEELTASIQESDSPGQDADLIMFLTKMQGKTLMDYAIKNKIEDENILNSLMRVYITKNRNGETGSFECLFDRLAQKFRSLTHNEPDPEPYEYDPTPDETAHFELQAETQQEEIDYDDEEDAPF